MATMLSATLPISASETSTTVPSSEEAETENYTPVTSGDIWDIAQSLDSSLVLEESDTSLMVTKEFFSEDTEKNIRIFFWDIVNFIKYPEVINTYDSVSFIYLHDGNLERVGITSLNSETDFSTSYIGPLSDDETIKKRFPTYYYNIFGAHDITSSLDKTMYEHSKELGIDYELPENYQNGYLWIFSNFDTHCGFEINDSMIYVELPGFNTVESGISTWKIVSSALDSFDFIKNSDPISMPYSKISIVCTEVSTDTTLWELTLEKINGSWETTKNQAIGDFLLGLSQ